MRYINSIIQNLSSAFYQYISSSTKNTPHPAEKPDSDPSKQIVMLPQEVMLKIFTFLDSKTLVTTSMVSKNWNQLSSDETLWKIFFTQIPEKLLTFYSVNNQTNSSSKQSYILFHQREAQCKTLEWQVLPPSKTYTDSFTPYKALQSGQFYSFISSKEGNLRFHIVIKMLGYADKDSREPLTFEEWENAKKSLIQEGYTERLQLGN